MLPKDATVLVIEDDELLRQAIASYLKQHGLTVWTAPDAQTGLALAQHYSPNLVLCDYDLPRKNGDAVLRALRGSTATADIPFVFMSGMAPRCFEATCHNHTLSLYLAKPFRAQQLLQLTEVMLEASCSSSETSVIGSSAEEACA